MLIEVINIPKTYGLNLNFDICCPHIGIMIVICFVSSGHGTMVNAFILLLRCYLVRFAAPPVIRRDVKDQAHAYFILRNRMNN